MASTRRASNSSATRYPAVPQSDYASDRSPLQKLEVALDSLTKEEKRSRMEEAELKAQEKAQARRTKSKAPEYRESRSQPSRRQPDYYDPPPPPPAKDSIRERSNRAPSNRSSYPDASYPPKSRAPPEDAQTTKRARADVYNNATPIKDERRRSDGGARVLRKPPPPEVAGAYSMPDNAPPTRQRSVREGRVFDPDPGYTDTQGNPVSPPAVRSARRDYAFPTEEKFARGPTVLSKHPPAEYRGAEYRGAENRDAEYRGAENRSLDSRGVQAPQGVPLEPPSQAPAQESKLRRRFTNPFRRQHHEAVPPMSPGTAAVGAAAVGGAAGIAAVEHHRHLPHLHHHDERKYQKPQYRDYRKNIRVAKVALDEPEPTAQQKKDDIAWWEKNGTSKPRRSSASAGTRPQSMAYDGPHDDGGQTFFNPPLYLKCGPLLRFTGIRRGQRSTSRATSRTHPEKEVWTGSIMIVTVDSKSSYGTPPTLRIFKQPVELLPPPPVEINEASGQQLHPEYVDPIAGQVKVSRVGKTLYVKPADALDEHRDLSRVENDSGLFEETRSLPYAHGDGKSATPQSTSGLRFAGQDGEKRGKYQEIPGFVLHSERGATFWKFNIEVELGQSQLRLAYRINRGPAIGFWVPARAQTMNMMFYSCNGFSLSVDPNHFSGPDPLWRDVLNSHQTRPFHVMLGGGDQIYNDAATTQTRLFGEWSRSHNQIQKNDAPFSEEMQDELEDFYFNRYAMWFSQGLFGMATSQIPMVNIWDDHDIIDGFGSYPDHTMRSPVMSGIGNVAFKYYMLFQHQALPVEDESTEPSWLLGAQPGPYINELSRSVFMFLGSQTAFLGLDCRTERMRGEILCPESWDLVFARLKREIVKGETQHLILLLGIPIAYPRLNFLENVLTSRLIDPIKALGRTGALGGFVNKFDGGVEILDDLDDHWTAKHHKEERNWFIQDLQEFAAEKSVRVTILGGDVHLAAAGQFYSNKKLGIPKDQDHRYMPNIISSAIVNTPPSDLLADVLNKRNKVHHLDADTDEDMIPMFPSDVNNKPRNNHHLLPRRNWCSIREYIPESTPPPTPNGVNPSYSSIQPEPAKLSRTNSLGRGNSLLRRFSTKGRRESATHPPISYPQAASQEQQDYFNHRDGSQRRASTDVPRGGAAGLPPVPMGPEHGSRSAQEITDTGLRGGAGGTGTGVGAADRPSPFLRRPTVHLPNNPNHMISLHHALDIRLNVENEQGDPAGTTSEYRLLVPALDYRGPADINPLELKRSNTGARAKGKMRGWFAMLTERGQASPSVSPSGSERSASAASHEAHRKSYDGTATVPVPSGVVSANHIPPGGRRSSGVPGPAGRVSGSGAPPLGSGGVVLSRGGAPLQRGSLTSTTTSPPRGPPPVAFENTAAGRAAANGARRASADGGRRGSLDVGRRGSMDAPARIRGNFGGFE